MMVVVIAMVMAVSRYLVVVVDYLIWGAEVRRSCCDVSRAQVRSGDCRTESRGGAGRTAKSSWQRRCGW